MVEISRAENNLGFRNTFLGPFQVGTKLFVLTTTTPIGDSPTLSMYKSTNEGIEWFEVDAAHHPSPGDPTMVSVYASGPIMHIAFQDSANRLSLVTFNGSTELWGTPDPSTITPNPNISGNPPIFNMMFNTGSQMIFYQGPTERISGTDYRKVYYVIRDSGGFGTPVLTTLAGVRRHEDIEAFSADRINNYAYLCVVYSDSANINWFTYRLESRTRSLSGAGSYDVSLPYMQGIPAINGNNTEVINVLTRSGYLVLNIANTGPNSTSEEYTTTIQAEGTNSNPCSVVCDGSDIYLVYVSDTGQDLYLAKFNGTDTDTPILIDNTIDAYSVSANILTYSDRIAIGIIYTVGMVYYYREYTLRLLSRVEQAFWKTYFDETQEVFATISGTKPGAKLWARINY